MRDFLLEGCLVAPSPEDGSSESESPSTIDSLLAVEAADFADRTDAVGTAAADNDTAVVVVVDDDEVEDADAEVDAFDDAFRSPPLESLFFFFFFAFAIFFVCFSS